MYDKVTIITQIWHRLQEVGCPVPCTGDSHHKVAAEAPARAEATGDVETHGAVIKDQKALLNDNPCRLYTIGLSLP